MGKSSPSAPDPYQSAAAQYQYGTQAASYNKALNATNTYGPTGSTTNAITGYDPKTGAPRYSQTTTLSPIEQSLLHGSQVGGLTSQQIADQQMAQLKGLSAQSLFSPGSAPKLQTSLDTSNVSPLPSGASLDALGRGAQATALAGEHASMDPAWNNREEQLKAQLVNSGNGPGTPAYENAMREFSASRTSADTAAAGSAITAGTGLEQTRYGEAATSNAQQFQQDLQKLTAENTAKGMSQQDAIAAAQAQLNQRGAVASQAGSLYGGAGATIPSASGLPTSSAATPDIMSAFQNQYQGQLNAYNANTGTENAAIGDAAMIASMYFM